MELITTLAAAESILNTSRKDVLRKLVTKMLDRIANGGHVEKASTGAWRYRFFDDDEKTHVLFRELPVDYARGPDFSIVVTCLSRNTELILVPLKTPNTANCIVDATLADAAASHAKILQEFLQDPAIHHARMTVSWMLHKISAGEANRDAHGMWHHPNSPSHHDLRDPSLLDGSDYTVYFGPNKTLQIKSK